MMEAFLALALKSLLVAGAGLVLLALLKKRSASERSWVAHITLLALLLLPLAPLVLPALHVEAPRVLTSVASEVVQTTSVKPRSSTLPTISGTEDTSIIGEVTPASPVTSTALSNVNWTQLAYWTPAIVLLIITLLAVGRLATLRARADVLVDAHWLAALARAQRRMGFKHGTALLISDELSSPISWGLMRPVILLNTRAVEAADEAEAIIAHELAHVARLDWIKLLLARVTTAVFWFNPLVWLLAREAHQLREEAADDAVLDADIPDTDYAELLVGVARHECRGLLIGAHGVAPSKGSLSRRVARVLDSGLARGPAARSFAAGVFVGAAALAAPLAAVTLSPGPAQPDSVAEVQSSYYPDTAPTYSPVVANSVSGAVASSVAGAVAAVHPHAWSEEDQRDFEKDLEKSLEFNWDRKGPRPRAVGPHDRTGPKSAIDLAIEMKAVGATPAYARSLLAAAPQLGRIDAEELVELAAVGVSAAYIRDLAAAGQRNLDVNDIMQARALGITGGYIRGMAAVGLSNLSMNELTEMKAVGVTPQDVQQLRKAGYGRLTAKQVAKFKAVGGFDPDEDDEDPDPDDDS